MKFVNRLTSNQISGFLYEHGIRGDIVWNPELYCAYVGKKCIEFSDKSIQADRFFEISNEDWQVYLRRVFGAEYVHFLKKKDYPNSMICSLSLELILKLLKFNHIYDLRECEPLIVGTRRFKIKYEYDGPYHDVVIGPIYDVGNIKLYGITEEQFNDFMTDIFGAHFVSYWVNLKYKELSDKTGKYSGLQKKNARKWRNDMLSIMYYL